MNTSFVITCSNKWWSRRPLLYSSVDEGSDCRGCRQRHHHKTNHVDAKRTSYKRLENATTTDRQINCRMHYRLSQLNTIQCRILYISYLWDVLHKRPQWIGCLQHNSIQYDIIQHNTNFDNVLLHWVTVTETAEESHSIIRWLTTGCWVTKTWYWAAQLIGKSCLSPICYVESHSRP